MGTGSAGSPDPGADLFAARLGEALGRSGGEAGRGTPRDGGASTATSEEPGCAAQEEAGHEARKGGRRPAHGAGRAPDADDGVALLGAAAAAQRVAAAPSPAVRAATRPDAAGVAPPDTVRAKSAAGHTPDAADRALAPRDRPAGRDAARAKAPEAAGRGDDPPGPRPAPLAHPALEARPARAPEIGDASPPAVTAPLPIQPATHEVGGALLRSAAHLRVETAGAGSLELHLRLRDGALHLRVDGEAAHLVAARSAELSRALSSEGLKLAPIEAPHRSEGTSLQPGSDDRREQRRDGWHEAGEARDDASRPAAPRARPIGPTTARRPGRGHVDVQA